MLDPKKINSFILIDFETTGVDKSGLASSQKYAATECAVMAVDGVRLEKIVAYDNLIKPYGDHIYHSEAAEKTGISRDMCEREGVTVVQLVDDLVTVCKEANIHNSKNYKPIFVAHNWPFDRQFLKCLFDVAGVDLSKYISGDYEHGGSFVPHGIDTIDLAKMCWGDITESTTRFNLEACCERAGIEFIDAHRAMNDIIPMHELLIYFVNRLRTGHSVGVQDISSDHRQVFEW